MKGTLIGLEPYDEAAALRVDELVALTDEREIENTDDFEGNLPAGTVRGGPADARKDC
jgi:hypothetical protein